MVFSPLVVGCLVKKGLQKGGSRAPQDPPGYALVLIASPRETLKESSCCVEQSGGKQRKLLPTGVTRTKESFTKKLVRPT